MVGMHKLNQMKEEKAIKETLGDTGRFLGCTKDGKKSQNDLRKVEKKLRQVQHLRDKKLKGAQLSAEEEARRPGDFMLMGSDKSAAVQAGNLWVCEITLQFLLFVVLGQVQIVQKH